MDVESVPLLVVVNVADSCAILSLQVRLIRAKRLEVTTGARLTWKVFAGLLSKSISSIL